jgi:hypothetical protein
MFTRDLRLEDCVLDLIDNSMDALLATRGTNIDSLILAKGMGTADKQQKTASIRLEISDRRLSITDDCGGIRYDDAINDVFCFGHGPDVPKKRLGIYGIGLKRAIFKIGNQIRIESKTGAEGFEVDIDVNEWAKKDSKLEDWRFPITRTNGESSLKKPGTTIVITQLHEEVKARLNDGTIDKILTKSVAQSYPFFLDSLVEVRIGGDVVPGTPIPFGSSKSIDPGLSSFTQDDVKVSILATVAPKDMRSQDLAGWYIICNGRVVVNANKDDLTGWGNPLPSYHSKYRGFIGLASFTSEDPARLPWTTSKRGLNRENLVFQRARNVMAGVARPVLTFLNQMYPSDLDESPVERQVADSAVQKDFTPFLSGPSVSFARRLPPAPKKTVRVQFDAKSSDIERIKKKLRRSGMSASDIGRHTFQHYLQTECAE